MAIASSLLQAIIHVPKHGHLGSQCILHKDRSLKVWWKKKKNQNWQNFVESNKSKKVHDFNKSWIIFRDWSLWKTHQVLRRACLGTCYMASSKLEAMTIYLVKQAFVGMIKEQRRTCWCDLFKKCFFFGECTVIEEITWIILEIMNSCDPVMPA